MTKCNDFLNFITLAQMPEATRQSAKLYIFQTAVHQIISTDKQFGNAVIHTFSLKSHLLNRRPEAAVLAAALSDALYAAGDTRVDILWPFADGLPKAFLQAKIQFFRDIACSVNPAAGLGYQRKPEIRLRLYLVCANEYNQRELEAELGTSASVQP